LVLDKSFYKWEEQNPDRGGINKKVVLTRNDPLIIENKKPFEIVQEVNNEVPSFEEFMKTYESDGNSNYDDLNSGDVGESKGYGPCGTCNKPVRTIEFKMACPATGCGGQRVSY